MIGTKEEVNKKKKNSKEVGKEAGQGGMKQNNMSDVRKMEEKSKKWSLSVAA